MNPLNTNPCKACTQPFTINNADTKFYVCANCGALFELGGLMLLKNRQFFNPAKNKPISQLKLGTTFVYERKTYRAINRIRWETNFREFEFTSNGEHEYSQENWIFDEWCMMADDKSVIYISEDNENVTFSIPFTPKFPNIPKFDQIRDFTNNNLCHTQESGYALVKYFEGESTEEPILNERIEYGFYTQNNINYIVEWEIGENGTTENATYYKEVEIKRSQMGKYQFEAPGKKRIYNFSTVNPITSEFKLFLRNLSLAGILLSVVFLIVSWSTEPKTIYKASVPPADTSEYLISNLDGYVTYTLKRPVILIADNSVCKVSLFTNLTSQSETDAEVRILNSNFEKLHNLSGEFYLDYSDGETDRKTETHQYFQFSESDSYYIEITIPEESTNSFTFEVTIESGVVLSRYFVMAFFVFLILHTYVFVDQGGAKLRRHFELLSK